MAAFVLSALSVFFSFENVASFYSSGGLVFGIVNIVGNFGAVFADQAYKYLLSQPLLSDQFSGQFSSPGLLAIRCRHEACQGDVIKKTVRLSYAQKTTY